jgi:aryl-alcohol dehydrogenase-like predicted oxidoreductase
VTSHTLPAVRLGRTELQVTAAGLGCGGHSRLGQTGGASFDDSVNVVRRALDLGVTFIDTARAYGTEEIVGAAVKGRRDRVVLSSKSHPGTRDTGPLPAARLRESVELSLRRLGTDYIDVFHLHGVPVALYDHCRDELVPEMHRLRDEGKIRFVAISEVFGADPGHEMLQQAVKDDCFDVMMVGFNLLNPSARDRVFAATQDKDVGVLIMFAVRRALSQRDELARVVRELVERGEVDATDVDLDDPLGFLVHEGGAASTVEAAYRFTRHEPGAHVTLTGTGNVAHLEENLVSLSLPPLPRADLDRLDAIFGRVDSVSGN